MPMLQGLTYDVVQDIQILILFTFVTISWSCITWGDLLSITCQSCAWRMVFFRVFVAMSAIEVPFLQYLIFYCPVFWYLDLHEITFIYILFYTCLYISCCFSTIFLRQLFQVPVHIACALNSHISYNTK